MRSIFQWAADRIMKWKMPAWFLDTIEHIWNMVLVPTIREIGKEAYDYLVKTVIEASKLDATGNQKKEYVITKFKESINLPDLQSWALNLLIEHIVSYLKHKKIID